MRVMSGDPDIVIGLVDGAVADLPLHFVTENIRHLSSANRGRASLEGAAAAHGTFIAGIFAARRGSVAPAVCPGCTLLVRPIFLESGWDYGEMPSASADDTAEGIAECVDAGARLINLSIAVSQPSLAKESRLHEALSYAARRGTIVIAAAGNQGTISSSTITGHGWVIPVTACDHLGQPVGWSNLGASIGRRGLRAPGEQITSIGIGGVPTTSGGTSAAAALVSGAVALLWSAFPTATVTEIKRAITQVQTVARRTIVPPLLNGWSAYQTVSSVHSRKTTA